MPIKGKIYIGSDNAGFELKNEIIKYLKDKGYDVVDIGPFAYDKADDYPDYAVKLCNNVLKDKAKGILVCSTGAGTAMVSNKIRGIYAANCWSVESARLAKVHQNINVLCLGASLIDEKVAKDVVETWLTEPETKEERHIRRLQKIKKIDEDVRGV